MAGSLTMVYDIIARDRASAVFARTGASAETAGARIGALGKALGVFAAIDIGAHAVKMAADFQKSTNVFVTAAGETTANLKTVRAGILNIATGTGAPIKGLTDSMYLIEKAGIRGSDGLKVLRASAQGAAEENANLATVTQAVTSIMQSYHLNANDSVNITNELKAAAGESKVTMEQFAGSLSTVLPIASANHIAFADVAGALATLTQHGTSADEATQELSNTIRQLAAPNQVASKEMAQLGISSNEVSQQLGTRGLTGTLEYLSETVLHKMGPSGLVLLNTFNQSKTAAQDAQTEFGALGPEAQKLAKSFEDGSVGIGDYRKAAKGLGGEQGALALQFLTTYTNAHGFQDLLKQGGTSAQTYTEAIKKMTGGANGLNTTLQITGESLAGTEERTRRIADAFKLGGKDVQGWQSTQKLFSTQMAEFRNQISVLGIKIGTGLLPVVTGVVHVLGNGLGVVSRNSELFGTLAKVIGGAAVAYYTVALATKVYEAASLRVASAVKGLTSAYVLLRAATVADYAQWGLSAARFGVVAAGIAGVVAGLHSLTSGAKDARQIVASLDAAFDPSNPATYNDEVSALRGRLHDLSGPAGVLKGILGTITFGKVGPAGSNLVDTQKAIQSQLNSLTGKSRNAKETIFELSTQFHLTDGDIIQMAHDMGINLSGNIQQTINKFRSLIATQSDYIRLKSGTQGALLAFNQGLLELRGNLDRNVHDWSDNTSAGIRNQQAIADLSVRYADYSQHLRDSQVPQDVQVQKLGTLRARFLDQLTAITGNRDQANKLLDTFGLFPPEVKTDFNFPGLAEGNILANNLANTIRNLPTRKDIDVAIHQQTSGPAGQFAPYLGLGTGGGYALGPGHADGGFINGPGGPRDDRILSMLSNGEFVVNAASTSQFRPLLEAINGPSRPTAARFATGGPVAITGKTQTLADFKLDAVKPDNKVFDDLFKAPGVAQKKYQPEIDKATKTAFIDPQAFALDKSGKAAKLFGDQMPTDFAKRITSHGPDISDAYKNSVSDPWTRTAFAMNVLAEQTGKSVPARIVAGFTNAFGAVKAASDRLLALVQRPIDALHGKTVEIVANTSITGVVTAATGGYIRGPGGPRDDAIPARLSNGEFVMNAESTKKHLPLLHHLNKARGYADGGLVTPEFSNTGAGGAKESAAFERLMALAEKKLSAEAQKRADAFASTFFNFAGPPGSSFQDIIAVMQKSGIPFLINSTTGGGHATNSYHYRGMAVDFGAPGNNPAQLGRIASYWYGLAGSLLEEIYSGGGGKFVKNGQKVGPGIYSSVLAEHFSHVHVAATDAAMQRILGVGTGGGVKQWDSVILRALQLNGLSPSLLGKVERQMATESGGARTILQSVHDVNSGPNAARGLMQVIPTTFSAYHVPGTSGDIFDALANVAAGLNYAKHRYGPNLNGLGEGHGYANGGYPPIGRPFWVGERGPELMVAGTQTRVYSNSESQKMAGDDRTTAVLVDALRRLPAGIGRAVAAELNNQASGSRLNGRTYTNQHR